MLIRALEGNYIAQLVVKDFAEAYAKAPLVKKADSWVREVWSDVVMAAGQLSHTYGIANRE